MYDRCPIRAENVSKSRALANKVGGVRTESAAMRGDHHMHHCFRVTTHVATPRIRFYLQPGIRESGTSASTS